MSSEYENGDSNERVERMCQQGHHRAEVLVTMTCLALFGGS